MKLNRRSAPPVLAKGQIWKIAGSYVQIAHLGKWLGEVRTFQDLEKRRGSCQMTSIRQIQDWLIDNKATLLDPLCEKPPVREAAAALSR